MDSNTESFTKADLLSILQSLMQNQQEQTPMPRNHIVKIAEPNKFSGERDIALIDAWFLSIERYLEHYQVDPSNWVTTTVHFLDGRAIVWWNRLHRLGTCPTVWIEFKQILNREFKPLFANQTARDRFAILKQGNLSVQDYVHQLQDILLEATDIAEPEAIDHFVRNLKPALYAKVRGSRPTSLDDAFKAAFDEEICLLPPGTTSTISSASLTSSFVPQMNMKEQV
ncbi:hypothetical protein INT46_004379 [Mucor plumbeus]|uniref:Retrotransposon gag domain-containing protein n=1 Tax=Mucor plumbeus TaxID=97098 RepID=A0A8H7QER6_9FUNG|nr:hypothetical protein INT46_004379 [Mucor plumbeus]